VVFKTLNLMTVYVLAFLLNLITSSGAAKSTFISDKIGSFFESPETRSFIF
jgi:hypothetical protein